MKHIGKQLFQLVTMTIEVALLLSILLRYWDQIPYLGKSPETNYDNYLLGFASALVMMAFECFNRVAYYLWKQFTDGPLIWIILKWYHVDQSSLLIKIDAMNYFIFSTKCKWSVTKNSEVIKVANTAEGMIACACAKNAGIFFSEHDRNELKSVIDRLIQEFSVEGYKSYNVNQYTAHCTGMTLYALGFYQKMELVTLDDDTYEQVRQSLKHLLGTSSQFGWGFQNQKYDDFDYIRIFSTFWALRALNEWGFSGNRRFQEIIINLLNKKQGKFGFSLSTEPKIAPTAMFLILLSEIKEPGLKKKIDQIITPSVKKRLISFLVNGLDEVIEVEEFLQDKEYFKKLPWTHLTLPINLTALAVCYPDLSIGQKYKMLRGYRRLIADIDDRRGFYLCRQMNFNLDDPFFYPTSYAMMACCQLKQCLDATKGKDEQL
ncbi:MAG: hypothetical protein HFE39_10490 [Clostridiales bacterium]|nr:hypothetical protein [Clostridiales bacterium]